MGAAAPARLGDREEERCSNLGKGCSAGHVSVGLDQVCPCRRAVLLALTYARMWNGGRGGMAWEGMCTFSFTISHVAWVSGSFGALVSAVRVCMYSAYQQSVSHFLCDVPAMFHI